MCAALVSPTRANSEQRANLFLFIYVLLWPRPCSDCFGQTAAREGVLSHRPAAATLRPSASCSCTLATEEAGAAGSAELIKIHRADTYRT